MAIRFRKSFRIAPGVRINLSKSGISTSVGPRGASVNFRGGKRKLTTSIPGTGLSQQHDITPRDATETTSFSAWWLVIGFFFLLWVFT